jgi:hypothetical protein
VGRGPDRAVPPEGEVPPVVEEERDHPQDRAGQDEHQPRSLPTSMSQWNAYQLRSTLKMASEDGRRRQSLDICISFNSSRGSR